MNRARLGSLIRVPQVGGTPQTCAEVRTKAQVSEYRDLWHPYWRALAILGLCCLFMLAGCSSPPSQTPPPLQPSTDRSDLGVNDRAAWATISKIIGHPGSYANQVYTITIPRDDLDVNAEIGTVPTAAGIASQLYFFKCPCGRMSVTGRFVVADYEANDVIAALQEHAYINITSMAPMFLQDRPRVLVIQYQGEGEVEPLAKVLRRALDYTATQRMAPVKAKD